MHYQKRASRSRKITDRFKTSHNTSEIQPLEPRRLFTVFYVNSVTDNISAVDHVISLREAMTAAATNSPCGNAPAGSPGLDTIRFNIPGSGLKTIQPASALPVQVALALVMEPEVDHRVVDVGCQGHRVEVRGSLVAPR